MTYEEIWTEAGKIFDKIEKARKLEDEGRADECDDLWDEIHNDENELIFKIVGKL